MRLLYWLLLLLAQGCSAFLSLCRFGNVELTGLERGLHRQPQEPYREPITPLPHPSVRYPFHQQLPFSPGRSTQLLATVTNSDDNSDISHSQITVEHLDVSALDPCRNVLLEWLSTLSGALRSPPHWVQPPSHHKDKIASKRISVHPSDLLDPTRLLDWIQQTSTTDTDPTILTRLQQLLPRIHSLSTLDAHWHDILSRVVPDKDLQELLTKGQSNQYPSRLQLVAIPPHSSFPIHVHPAAELDIPLVGELYEHVILGPSGVVGECVSRQELTPPGHGKQEHQPTRNGQRVFVPPTSAELSQRKVDLTTRLEPSYHVRRPCATENDRDTSSPDPDLLLDPHAFSFVSVPPAAITSTSTSTTGNPIIRPKQQPSNSQRRIWKAGDCLVNPVGCVHQSYTMDLPCLLLALGPNVHGHFKEYTCKWY